MLYLPWIHGIYRLADELERSLKTGCTRPQLRVISGAVFGTLYLQSFVQRIIHYGVDFLEFSLALAATLVRNFVIRTGVDCEALRSCLHPWAYRPIPLRSPEIISNCCFMAGLIPVIGFHSFNFPVDSYFGVELFFAV